MYVQHFLLLSEHNTIIIISNVMICHDYIFQYIYIHAYDVYIHVLYIWIMN